MANASSDQVIGPAAVAFSSTAALNGSVKNPETAKLDVSVVIPAYNAAATLAETLQSLLAQTHPHWEAIVVDDGSTDDTAGVAAEFAARDGRIRLVRRANGGEAAARNTGIAEACHAWLLFLDADDWISPLHLQRMTAALAADPALDAVHCGYERVTQDGTHVPERFKPPTGEIFRTLARRAAFAVHACVVRKSLVEDVGGFDASLRKSPDWDLWQRIARTGARFGAVREVLAYYRMAPNSASLEARQMLRDGLRVLRQGHAPDPRVRKPHAAYAQGMPPEQMLGQQYYLLCWCAGVMIGRGEDPRPLLEMIDSEQPVELYPDAVAQCVFESAPLAACRSSRAWDELWPQAENTIDEFLAALESHCKTHQLASRATIRFKELLLSNSPVWRDVIDDLQRARSVLREDRDNWRRIAEDRGDALEPLQRDNRSMREERDDLQRLAEERAKTIADATASLDRLQHDRQTLHAERDDLQRLADERASIIADATASFDRLQHDRQTLHSERDDLQRLVEERAAAIAESTASLERLQYEHQALRTERDGLQRLADERQIALHDFAASVQRLEQVSASLDTERAALQTLADQQAAAVNQLKRQVSRLDAECKSLQSSPERQAGDFLLNRLRLKRPAFALRTASHRLQTARLAADGRLTIRRKRLRMMATVCTDFPIYSQTFVYQELSQLIEHGFDLRLVYSKLAAKDQLSTQFSRIWPLRRQLQYSRGAHERDFAHYRARMPEKVEALVEKLCESSGLSREALLAHDAFLQAFSFTRLAEAYRPHYLHSYFFYDRSLMALVASWMLDIPRGVSCYADHVLKDYELKVVPLHLELCNVVVATSNRIKQELLTIAPQTDPEKILVKPNGIDANNFPIVERAEPAGDAPFRLVSLCRIEPKKGLLDLVEAVHLLRQRGLRVEAHIVGAVDDWSEASRNYKQQLDQRITELGLWGTVHLEGRHNLDGIRRFLGISHLFVAPFVETDSGDKDGIPTALLEGMSTGLPAVATLAGSIPEVIEDGLEGLLVPQHNPAALADAIESLLRDADRREEFGQRAAEKVRGQFDVRDCERTLHERINSVLKNR